MVFSPKGVVDRSRRQPLHRGLSEDDPISIRQKPDFGIALFIPLASIRQWPDLPTPILLVSECFDRIRRSRPHRLPTHSE